MIFWLSIVFVNIQSVVSQTNCLYQQHHFYSRNINFCVLNICLTTSVTWEQSILAMTFTLYIISATQKYQLESEVAAISNSIISTDFFFLDMDDWKLCTACCAENIVGMLFLCYHDSFKEPQNKLNSSILLLLKDKIAQVCLKIYV